VLAGEDQNDCEILAALIRAHRPDVCDVAKLVRINDPVRLRKKSGADLSAAVKALVGKARAKALQQRAALHGIVVHEDFDSFTGARYSGVRTSVSAELTRQSSPCDAVFALAAWESEAWILLFPDAFTRVHPRWKVPSSLSDKDTGRIEGPKEKLKHGLGTPMFRESDGPRVARAAYEHGLVGNPKGSNRSYDDFVADLEGAWI
jgi:hypothetical protein